MICHNIKEPQNGIYCLNFLKKKSYNLKAEALFHTTNVHFALSCLSACCLFPLCSMMYFSLRENMRCSMRAA